MCVGVGASDELGGGCTSLVVKVERIVGSGIGGCMQRSWWLCRYNDSRQREEVESEG